MDGIEVSARVSNCVDDLLDTAKGNLEEKSDISGSVFARLDIKHSEQYIRDIFTTARDSHTPVSWEKIIAFCIAAYANDHELD
jgi:hypothetical protein